MFDGFSQFVLVFLTVCLQFIYCNIGILQPVADAQTNYEDVLRRVTLLCYRSNENDYHVYTYENITELLSDTEYFNINNKTIIYIAGHQQDLNADTTILMLQSLFIARDRGESINICQYNYTAYSTQPILPSFFAANTVGKVLAALINVLYSNGVPQDSINLIGHSLGAQVAGGCGRNTTIALIVGQDPAGPLFMLLLKSIESGQASCVVCISTDRGFYGQKDPRCDINIIINGGRRYQPGCPFPTIAMTLQGDDLCSHQRSVNYTAYAVIYPEKFLAVRCIETITSGLQCEGNSVRIFDLIRNCSVDKSLFGNYYLITGGEAPFGLGEAGVVFQNSNVS